MFAQLEKKAVSLPPNPKMGLRVGRTPNRYQASGGQAESRTRRPLRFHGIKGEAKNEHHAFLFLFTGLLGADNSQKDKRL
ncbi:MAG: hypothetical protein ACI4BD_08045 [Paludibacteraceae bacterium]